LNSQEKEQEKGHTCLQEKGHTCLNSYRCVLFQSPFSESCGNCF
jgi:hypothetical protein